MENEHESDWDPMSEQNQKDQRAAYDQMRQKYPVAHSQFFGWTLFRHDDVMRALLDPETFSNAVSHHLSVPNGMDPPEHTEYRRIIEPYFSPERMERFEPVCRTLVKTLLSPPLKQQLEFMSQIALPFAVRVRALSWAGRKNCIRP